MSRGIWKAVETKVRKTGVAKTEKRGEKIKRKKKEKSSRQMGDLR